MTSRSTASSRAQTMAELGEALGSALDLRTVLTRAYPLLTRLVPADYGALGISSTGRPENYEWMVARLPPEFFAAYPEMAPHDFVRAAVLGRPNLVLRDEDIIARSALEANMMYRRARAVGAPLEQVMAVMLHVEERWQSGLSLYRDRQRPFTIGERATLQRVTPLLANTVRNCHLFAGATCWSAALERALQDRGLATMLVSWPGRELARSEGAAALVERWFAPHERPAGALPKPLAAGMAEAVAPGGAGRAPRWRRPGPSSTLEVSFLPLPPGVGPACCLLMFEERSPAPLLPAAWRPRLTPREQEVASALLRGWDNQLIAGELGCSLATVKKHLQNIFDELGLASRAGLLAAAALHR